MNIKLSLFVNAMHGGFGCGAYFESPMDHDHHFFAEHAANEESAIIAIINQLDDKFEELGQIEFITTTTLMLNFLCKGVAKEKSVSAPALKAVLRKLNQVKGTRFKKNETPEATDAVALSRADMMAAHIDRYVELKGEPHLYYTAPATLAPLKKGYKKLPHLFLGPKIFHWEATELVELEGIDHTIYYNGKFTPKDGKGKPDNNISDLEKELRKRHYSYYSGSFSKLTDAGQRSLEEVRCVSLVKEKHPIIERYFDVQNAALTQLPVTPVYTANIDKIIGGASSLKLMEDELHWFKFNSENGDMIFNGISRSDISYVFYPQRLGPRIRNQFRSLKDKFINHLNGKIIGEEYDITDLLYTYETNAKGKTVVSIKEVLNGNFNFIKIPKMSFNGANFTLKYVFDIDSPHIRILKGLAKYNPKVSIVFEDISDTTIGYYTIVRTDIGVSIYSCPEGSRLVRRRK